MYATICLILLAAAIVIGGVLYYRSEKEGYFNYTKEMNNTSGLRFDQHQNLHKLQQRAAV
jgi:hypothetical protein